ncbi:hypothetical protein OK074_0914 [Actinobacteria bacterium OK074]|nr:hypothetical protein OK074_0914 [Actinobacteria bacterium OK074]
MTATPLGRRNGRSLLTGALCAGLVVTGTGVLAGCAGDPDAGTNGVGKLSPDKIQSRTRTAAQGASAVRLAGTVVSNGTTYTLDMRLKDEGGTGSVTSRSGTFRLLRIDDHLYLKANAEFWGHQETDDDGSVDTDAAHKLDGKYVKVPSGDPTYRRFSGFTDKDVLLDGLLTLHGTLSTDGHHDRNGTRTIRITGDKGSGGTLDVSLEGSPYPLRLVRAGNAGTLSLSAWGKDFALAEPDKGETVDYGQQLPTS